MYFQSENLELIQFTCQTVCPYFGHCLFTMDAYGSRYDVTLRKCYVIQLLFMLYIIHGNAPTPRGSVVKIERVLTENLHQVALTQLPPGTTLVNPCKSPHPRQIWGCKLDVKSQGYGACCVCKLAVFFHLLPCKVPTSPGGGGSGNKTGSLDLHVYA